MKLCKLLLPLACLLSALLLSAELIEVEETRWSNPVAQWGNQYRVRYTYDSETGLKEGIYEEMWLRDGEPVLIKSRVNYLHGEKHGEELVHEYFVYAPNWEKRIYWNHGVETGGKETQFWGWGPDDPSRPQEIREWEWEGDLFNETSTRYHEGNGSLSGTTESRNLRTPDLWIVLESHGIAYAENGTKTYESWQKSIRQEDGTWDLKYIGPYEMRSREDGTPWYYREYDANGQLHGKRQEWTEDGILRYTQNYRHGLRDGLQYSYNYNTGFPSSSQTLRMGIQHGAYRSYDYKTGILTVEGQFSNGNRCGVWTSYSNGVPVSVEEYGSCEPFMLVEEDPIFDEEAEPDTVKWIEGRVFDKLRKLPIGGVTIEASGGYQTITDPIGNFRLQLGSVSLYTLTLRSDGYKSRSGRLDMSDYQTRTLNISLIPEGADDKPSIVEIESRYGDVFFEGLVANNRYTANVDWSEGTASGINFQINGTDHAGSVNGDQGEISLNMASVLKPGLGPSTNSLKVTATNTLGIPSDPEILHPILVPLPDWLTTLGILSPGESQAGLINYKLSLQWPAEPVELELNQTNLGSLGWKAWSLMPLIGGQPFGLKSTQSLLDLELKTDGNGSALFGGQTGLQAGGQEITGKVGGRGHYFYRNGKGIEWKKGSLLVGIEGIIEKEAGVVDVIPALASAVNLPVVGRGIAWINRQAKISGTIGMGTDIELDILDQEGSLDFSHSEASLKASLKLGLGGGEGKLKLKFTGSGEARALFQVPANPDYLKHVEAEIGAELAVTAWLFEKTFSASHTFTYPTTAAFQTLSAQFPLADEAAFQPISRNFSERADYHRIAPETYEKLSSTDTTSWTTRIENVYPNTELHLYGGQSIHYIHFDPAKDTLRATEWHDFSLIYRVDDARTDDQNADFGLSVDNVAAWMRVKDPAFPEDGLLEEMASRIEIACSNNYLTPDKAPLYVTDNDFLDLNPVVVRYGSGYYLFWESNEGNQLIGSNDWPTRVHYAEWKGNTLGFQLVDTVPGDFVDASEFTYTTNDGELAMAWIQDMDGDMTTETDREIFTRYTVEGSWTAPLQITSNSTTSIGPQLLADPTGRMEVFWIENGALYSSPVDTAGMIRRSTTGNLPAVTHYLTYTLNPQYPFIFLIREDGDARDGSLIGWNSDTVTWAREIPLRLNFDTVDVHDFVLTNLNSMTFLFAGLQESDPGTNIVTTSTRLLASDFRYSIAPSYEPADPVPGQSFQIPVDWLNAGRDPLDSKMLGVYSGPPDTSNLLAQVEIPGTPESGEHGQVLFDFTVPEKNWSDELFVCTSRADGVPLDPYQAIPISVATTDLEVLRIHQISNPDHSSTVRVTVRNNGPFTAQSILVDLVSGSQTLDRATLPGLFSGKSAEIDLQIWPESDFLKDAPTLTAMINPGNTDSDPVPANNRMDFQLPGDDGLWSLSTQIGPVKRVHWFGTLEEINPDWIYHFDLGWLFVEAEDIGSLYFFDLDLGSWIWTRYDVYPCFYHFGAAAWWWYEMDRAQPLSTGQP